MVRRFGERLLELDVLQAVEKHLEARLQLLASQCGTDAEMRAQAERHVLVRVRAADIESIRLGELPLVAVRRAVAWNDQAVGRERDPV